ncbi:deoxynucleotide monophosphate kinase family protein [Pseudomonas sp. PB3P13]
MPTIIGLAAVARSGKDTVASMLLEHPDVSTFALADPLKAGCQALFGLTDDEAWSDDFKEKDIPLWRASPRQMFQRVGTEWLRDHNPEHWLLRADRQLNHCSSTPAPTRSVNTASPASPTWMAVQVFWGLSDEQTWIAENRETVDPFWMLTPNQMFSLIQKYLDRDFPTYQLTRKSRPVKKPKSISCDMSGKSIVVIKDIRYENEAEFWRNHNGIIWHITRKNAAAVNYHSSEEGIDVRKGDVVIENNGTLDELREKTERTWKALAAIK